MVPGICKGSGGRDVLKTSSDDNSLVAMIRAGIIPEESKTRRIKEKTARKVEKHWKTSFGKIKQLQLRPCKASEACRSKQVFVLVGANTLEPTG